MGRNKGKSEAKKYGLETSKMSRSYMMTVWYDKGVEFEKICEKMQSLYDDAIIKYACLSQEICPDTGRLHGHLYTRFVNSWSGVKAFKEYGIETGQGWFEEARQDYASFEYVACEGNFAEGKPKGKPRPLQFFEVGERPSKKEKGMGEYKACLKMIQDGSSFYEIMTTFPAMAIRSYTNLEKFYNKVTLEQKHKLLYEKKEQTNDLNDSTDNIDKLYVKNKREVPFVEGNFIDSSQDYSDAIHLMFDNTD